MLPRPTPHPLSAKSSRADLLGQHPDDELRRATLDALSVDPARRARVGLVPAALLAAWPPFAERNDVAPIVAHALLDHGRLSPAQRERWTAIHDASARRMRVLLETLDGVAEALAADDIRLVALKNAGIARGLYPCAACCPMGDLDVLIDRARFRDAHRRLLELGFELRSRSRVEPADLERALVGGGAEYFRSAGEQEVWLELQWRAVAGRWIRPEQEPAAPELLARSVPIPGTSARLLRAEDNLLQVALHTAKHTFVRAPGLRLHTDVDRIVAATPPAWDEVVRLARTLTVRTPVYLSLALAEGLLNTPVPGAVLAALSPPRWKRDLLLAWLRRADLFEPHARKFSRPGMLAFHALLYDDAEGLLASALDARPGELRDVRRWPSHLVRGAGRMADLFWRYQR